MDREERTELQKVMVDMKKLDRITGGSVMSTMSLAEFDDFNIMDLNELSKLLAEQTADSAFTINGMALVIASPSSDDEEVNLLFYRPQMKEETGKVFEWEMYSVDNVMSSKYKIFEVLVEKLNQLNAFADEQRIIRQKKNER